MQIVKKLYRVTYTYQLPGLNTTNFLFLFAILNIFYLDTNFKMCDSDLFMPILLKFLCLTLQDLFNEGHMSSMYFLWNLG